MSVSGFIYDVGLLYTITLNKSEVKENKAKPQKITIGLRGNSKTKFNTSNDVYNASVTNSFTALLSDTLLYKNNEKNTGYLPSSYGVGINYNNKNKWIFWS
ncbi:MAG: hypothetical protein R2771_03625 [Saprospiraceae bacterium]